MLECAKSFCPPKQMSPLTLAFLGDAVYELLMRERIVASGSMPPNKLHRRTVELVNASFQARAYDIVAGTLSEEEADILRRGRNSSGVHPPKNADVQDYRKATGLEALIGYLYLAGDLERIHTLMEMILKELSPAE